MEKLKELLQTQFKESYMDGVHQGAITTCAVIYHTMRATGLKENNILFTILKDLAQEHGCEDLNPIIEELAPSSSDTKSTILSWKIYKNMI